MKLHKQAPAKAFVIAAALGLLVAFFGLIKSEPRIKAESSVPAGERAVEYERFFAPGAASVPSSPPDTRTRAS